MPARILLQVGRVKENMDSRVVSESHFSFPLGVMAPLICISLPFLKRICPQIQRVIKTSFYIRASITHIKGGRDSHVSKNLKLVCIVPYPLSDLEGSITLVMSLFFLLKGNLSFLKCNHTRSPRLNSMCFLCLLAFPL